MRHREGGNGVVSDCGSLLTTDPMSAWLALLWLFAVGMYPLGLMLGAPCSPCCGQQGICTQSWGESCSDIGSVTDLNTFVALSGGLPCAVGVSFAGLSSTLYFTKGVDAPANWWQTGATAHCFSGYATFTAATSTGELGNVNGNKPRITPNNNPIKPFSQEILTECECERGTEYPNGFAGCSEIQNGYPLNFAQPYLAHRYRVCEDSGNVPTGSGIRIPPSFIDGTRTAADDGFEFDGVMCCTGDTYASEAEWYTANVCGGYGYELEATGGRLEPAIDVVESEEEDPQTGEMTVVTRKYCQCTSGRIIGATVSLKAIYWDSGLVANDGLTDPNLPDCCKDLYADPSLVVVGNCFEGAITLDNSHLG